MKKLLLIAITALSINANAQWVQQTSGTPAALTSVFFPSASTGYFLQDNGLMKTTTNSGTNWNSASTYNSMYGQLYFTSIDTGYATGMGIKKTVNGGLTWINNFPDSLNTVSVHFPISNIGYTFASNQSLDSVITFKTTNAGNSWSRISTFPSQGVPFFIFFTSPATGFMVVNADGIYKTINGAQIKFIFFCF